MYNAIEVACYIINYCNDNRIEISCELSNRIEKINSEKLS